MATFKCKICGGSLDVAIGATVAECEYCGTKQTLPRLDDDRKANLYDRANYLRRNNEFDAARGIYEQILSEHDADAENYWSLVLCRYGIEYVEDPSTHERIPTVNRAQFTSIFDDEDYKSAIKHADGMQRRIYEKEAKVIDDIQRGILSISEKEEPFDIFICYKETDALGRRTPDSVIAMDLYKKLTSEGYKVFFARITLEEKLGQEYEPYIFAALNSAKVMLVLGTKKEYFDAVWVKNEWSRYLALIKNGEKKTLIPMYKDMNPYDMPSDFSYLQAQDMAKLGFEQDLIHGIQKIIPLSSQNSQKTSSAHNESNLTELFLTNAIVALENGDFKGADTYYEKVLSSDPENAQAYLGKLMAELHVTKQSELAKCVQPFDNLTNYKKTIQYGDKNLVLQLEDYLAQINKRVEKRKKQTKRFKKLIVATVATVSSVVMIIAATVFLIIPGTKYISANRLLKNGRYEEAIIAFQTLDGFANSETKILDCDYQKALSLMNEGKYNEAIAIFEALHGFSDSTAQIMNCHYQIAIGLMNAGKYEEAVIAFEKLNHYTDSDSQITKIEGIIEDQRISALNDMYDRAVTFKNEGKYVEAAVLFQQLVDYKDSMALSESHRGILYAEAVAFMTEGKYTEAYQKFSIYHENDNNVTICKAMAEGRYGDAVRAGLQSVIIPEGEININANEFLNCSGLKSIVLPSTLKKI